MERRTWISLGSGGALWSFGFDLARDVTGAKAMIAELVPLIEALSLHIGIGFMIGGGGAFGATLWALDRKMANRLADIFDKFATDYDALFEGVAARSIPRKELARHVVYAEKYVSWLAHYDHEGHLLWDNLSANKAADYAAILRSYGYLRGRWRIYRKRRSGR